MNDMPVNPFPLVAEVLREAIAAVPAGDPLRVRDVIRRRMSGRHRSERLAVETVLAWTAASFAVRLSEEQREQVLARLTASADELRADLFTHSEQGAYEATKALLNRFEKAGWN